VVRKQQLQVPHRGFFLVLATVAKNVADFLNLPGISKSSLAPQAYCTDGSILRLSLASIDNLFYLAFRINGKGLRFLTVDRRLQVDV